MVNDASSSNIFIFLFFPFSKFFIFFKDRRVDKASLRDDRMLSPSCSFLLVAPRSILLVAPCFFFLVSLTSSLLLPPCCSLTLLPPCRYFHLVIPPSCYSFNFVAPFSLLPSSILYFDDTKYCLNHLDFVEIHFTV